MIDQLIAQMRTPLLEMGYYIGREASLQIAEGREPGIFIQRAMGNQQSRRTWNYELAAEELLAEVGIAVEAEIVLQAIHISEQETGRLTTIIEIISPNNETRPTAIADYRARRERLILEQGVNVVEVDATRSVKWMLNADIAAQYPYHVAIFMPGDSPRIIGVNWNSRLHRIAVPLRVTAIAAELQRAYDYAYQQVTFALQIHESGHYIEALLPFPTLLTDEQRDADLKAVATWQAELARLRGEK